MSRKKLLFITPELPYPPQSGGKVKSLKLLHALAQRYDVSVASPLKLEDATQLDAFHAQSPAYRHLHAPVAVPRTARHLALSYLEGRPLNVRRTFDTSLRDSIARLAAEVDIIVLDHYEVYAYLPDDFEGTVIYHAHNAYHKLWERYAELPGNPARRLAAFAEARRVRRYEAQVAGRADLVFAAPNDARELTRAGVSAHKIRDTYHLGDDAQLNLPELAHAATREKLVYVGFLGWEANVVGLLWFLEHVWPQLLRRRPDLRFDIVGKNPDARLTAAVSATRNVQLLGFVPDLETVYADSRVSVAPLLFGSGMKVKVLDAMARGLPVVTTSVGAEGIDAEYGTHLLVADDASEMTAGIGRLLDDEILWKRLQTHSRQLVRERYTWARLFDAMHSEIDAQLAGAEANWQTEDSARAC